jgi:20S proteasome alpha/beta subunit
LFIAVQIGLHPWSNTELDGKQMSIADCRRYVDTASKGLAEVVRSSKPTVQFIHESVRDFLLGKSGKRKRWPGFGVEFLLAGLMNC